MWKHRAKELAGTLEIQPLKGAWSCLQRGPNHTAFLQSNKFHGRFSLHFHSVTLSTSSRSKQTFTFSPSEWRFSLLALSSLATKSFPAPFSQNVLLWPVGHTGLLVTETSRFPLHDKLHNACYWGRAMSFLCLCCVRGPPSYAIFQIFWPLA